MRLGRSYSETRLGRPQVVFAPPPPTQQQQTIVVVNAVQSRLGWTKRFPPQWYEPSDTTRSDGAAYPLTERALGPDPPSIVSLTPTQQQQTLTVNTVSVRTRVETGRRAPHQVLYPALYLSPLAVVTTPGQLTLKSVYTPAAVRSRLEMTRRFPLQGFCGEEVAVGIVFPTFPQNSIQDNFTRANEATLGSPWSIDNGGIPANSVSLTSNTAKAVSNGAFAVYEPLGEIGDSEAYVSYVSGSIFAAAARWDDAGHNGYAVYHDRSFNSIVIAKYVNGVASNLNSTTLSSGNVGDQIMIRVIGSVIEAWFQPSGGSWTKYVTATDSTYATGYIGFGVPALNVSITNFGGGIISNPVLALTKRNLGPFPPQIVKLIASQRQQTIEVVSLSQAIVERQQAQQRRAKSLLFPPATIPRAPPVDVTVFVKTVLARPRPTTRLFTKSLYLSPLAVETTPGQLIVKTTLVRTRPRRTHSYLYAPTVVATTAAFVASPIATSLVVPDRIERRRFVSFLSPPTVLQTFAGPKTPLVKTRPRHTISRLTPLIFYPQTSNITVTAVHTRPRKTRSFLIPPVVLQVFAGPGVTLVKTRPRPTVKFVNKPTVIRVPSVEQQEDTIRVALVHTRPRPTTHRYVTPYIFPATSEISVTLAHTRPRKTRWFLVPPTTLQVFAGPDVTTVKTRPRPTSRQIFKPTVLRVPSVEQQEQTIRVTLTRARPRPTTRKLSPPTVITVNPPVDVTVNVTLAGRTRIEAPRRFSRYQLRPPTRVIPLPTQQMQTVLVALAKPVRKFTHSKLSKPTVLQTFSGPLVSLTRIRPRPTVKRFINPVTFKATSEILVALTRTRPRPTSKLLSPPTVVQTPPNRQQQTIQTFLVRTRPRPTTHRYIKPFFYAATSEITVALVKTRPRPTTRFVAAPAVVQRFTAEKIRVTCNAVGTRLGLLRRGTRTRLAPPTTIVIPPAVLYPISVTLAGRTRVEAQRRAPHYKLSKPVKVFGAPMIIRVTGPPQGAWTTRRMISAWEQDVPGGGMEAGKPVEGWETDTPGTDWEVGKPE